MSQFVESLRRLYVAKRLTKEQIDALLVSKKITQEEYDYITA